MAVPQDLIDGLAALQGDADDVQTKAQADGKAAAALADAQGAKVQTGHDLDAATAHQATDLTAFVAKVQAVYGPAAPPPPAPAPAP